MATTTPNFGWPVPTSTDLVKDGATAMEALGDAIDTSMVDLKGGTTGQVLAKASNTDMDFSWTSPNPGDITAVTAGTGISGGGTSGDVTVTNSMATAIDAKGDLIAGTGADAFSRLAVGTNGQVLTADSTTATGLSWGTVSGGFTYTTWTPTISGTTVGNGTVTARYAQSGKMVHAYFKLVFGSTSSVSGNTTISLPVTASSNATGTRGTGAILDSGVRWFSAVADLNGTTQVTFTCVGANLSYSFEEYLSSTTPMTWTTNDTMAFSIIYEAA